MVNNTHLFHPVRNTWNTGSCILNVLLEHWHYIARATVLLDPDVFVIPGKGFWDALDKRVLRLSPLAAGLQGWLFQVDNLASSSIPQRLPTPGSDNQHYSKVNGSLWLIDRKTTRVTIQGLGFIVLAI